MIVVWVGLHECKSVEKKVGQRTMGQGAQNKRLEERDNKNLISNMFQFPVFNFKTSSTSGWIDDFLAIQINTKQYSIILVLLPISLTIANFTRGKMR